MKLEKHYVEKPWGRRRLPHMFGGTRGRRIGEIWFAAPGAELPLLVKYIFSADRLSIQVHPNDEEAQARGLPRGKSECWYILDAEPGATLGLGLRRAMDKDALRAASVDGSIEQIMNWKAVQPGDFFVIPPGTIHAIGAGISLLEFQQNADITYRLYDYGRPRDLHLDDSVAVSNPEPYPPQLAEHVPSGGTRLLVNGPHYCLVRVEDPAAAPPSLSERRRWVMPLKGSVSSGRDCAGAGECLLLEPNAPLAASPDAEMLIGAEGTLRAF